VGEVKETIGRTVLYDVNTWQAFIVERRRLKATFLENLELFHFPFDTQVGYNPPHWLPTSSPLNHVSCQAVLGEVLIVQLKPD